MKDRNKILFGLMFLFGIIMVGLSSATITELTNSLADNNIDADGSVSWTATFNATLNETITCTLDFSGRSPSSNNFDMTEANSGDTADGNVYTCTQTLNNIPEQTYLWTISATNVTDTTTTTQRTLQVDVTTSAGKAAILIASGQAKSEGGASFSISEGIGSLSSKQIIIGLLLVGGVIFFFKKKK